MDMCVPIEILLFLLSLTFRIIDGFSIRGHIGTNQGRQRGEWNANIDTIRDMVDEMNNANLQPHHNQQQRPTSSRQQQPSSQSAYDTPEDSFLYNAFSSPNTGELQNKKLSLSSFSPEKDDVKYNYGLSNDEHNDDDVVVDDNGGIDDKIDLFASISYPQNVAPPVIDNLALSTKLGLLASPAKRQQGWYVQYGKRASPTDIDNNGLFDNSHSIDKELGSKTEKLNPIYSTNFVEGRTAGEEEEEDEDATAAGAAQNLQTDLELKRRLDRLEQRFQFGNIAYGILKEILNEKSKDTLQPISSSPVKRQQGWFTQYGKRGSDEVPSSFSSTKLRRSLEQLRHDMNVSDISYDILKSFVDTSSKDLSQPFSPEKRQQGWFTAYGKRSNEDGFSDSLS